MVVVSGRRLGVQPVVVVPLASVGLTGVDVRRAARLLGRSVEYVVALLRLPGGFLTLQRMLAARVLGGVL